MSKNKKDEDLFIEAFPEFKDVEENTDNIVDVEEDTDEEIFYIFDTVKDIFDIYNITINYVVNEFNSLDSLVLVELIKDKQLNMTESLSNITYIHSGFLSVVNYKAKTDG